MSAALSGLNPDLSSIPMDSIPGVGPQILLKLSKLGIRTVEDALYFLPLRYEDRRNIRPLASALPGERGVFRVEVLAKGENVHPRTRKRIFHVLAGDGSGKVDLKWFHYRRPWMEKEFPVGCHLHIFGEIKLFGGVRQIEHPEYEIISKTNSLGDNASSGCNDSDFWGGILPVYPLTEGLSQKMARRIWKKVVEKHASSVSSTIPVEILRRLQLPPLAEAFLEVHFPKTFQKSISSSEMAGDISSGRKSIIFDEFFYLELGLALKKRDISQIPGNAFQVTHLYTKPLAEKLPYRLTTAQRRVLGEIKQDMMASSPMNRLLQGDVGSGKTIVALMAALIAIENNFQVAVLAPTEILAEQHFLQFHRYLDDLGLKAALLTGSIAKREKENILGDLSAGRIHLLVGTHAILEDEVDFPRLGLVVIDEQHRFGVLQRGGLRNKGTHPDTLVMTATPIPRSLFMTAYGDLSLSIIDELPPGRKPVKTMIFPVGHRETAYRMVREELAGGRQAFVVYPLIEESQNSELQAAEKDFILLKNEIFPTFRVGLLHGRLKPAEKEDIMKRFRDHDLDILVATTVIEVGIDIPNATVMMVENADRFGLSQLHQLRGRVGRGRQESVCILIASRSISDDGRKRLQVMKETADGFRIAEADLEIRGPGELLGTRQHGLVDFRVASILKHQEILAIAREEAFQVAGRSDFFTSPELEKTRRTLQRRWGTRLELAAIG
ncbi:MAG: ATP-dependent DNA helicase RecG [Desulfuromonadaceae bacterium]|nr:ATP-dependent DNA helicase RecG [Desulfuromonadaceae bacterium]